MNAKERKSEIESQNLTTEHTDSTDVHGFYLGKFRVDCAFDLDRFAIHNKRFEPLLLNGFLGRVGQNRVALLHIDACHISGRINQHPQNYGALDVLRAGFFGIFGLYFVHYDAIPFKDGT